MTNVERVERDIAREKMFREAFMNGKEPTDEDRAAWALADAHNQMSLDYARQQKFIRIMAMILLWCNGCYSTVLLPLHRDILELKHKELKKRLRGTHSYYKRE